MYKKMLEMIKNADCIYIYRHISSDYDALGSTFGLKQLINDNFKDKEVFCMGEANLNLGKQMGISFQEHPFISKPASLAIVLDTANLERIDGEGFDQCAMMIKMDHHIVVDSYGDLNIEDPQASSASELVGRFYEANKDELVLTKQSARLLYYGIIGDTNRFMYEATSSKTMHIASCLLETGIDIPAIYESMYLREKKDLEVTAYILNHFIEDEGFAYYILDKEALDTLGITREMGSLFVNTLSNYKHIHVYAAITYQEDKDQWRVSLRSRHVKVQPIAQLFNGGGHIYASGATLKSLADLPKLVSLVKEAIKNEI